MSKLLASCHAVLCIMQICLMAGATEPHFFGGHSNLMRQQPRHSDSPPVYHSSVPLEMQQEYSSPMDNQMEKMRPTMHYKMPYDNDTTSVMNTILVESAHSSPVNILFRSTSSSVNVLQDHRRSKGIVHYMNSQEEPVVLVMNISKPVIQKVNEKFLPKRYITQEIYPIKETVETIIKDAPRDKYLGDSETHSNEQNSNNAMKPMFHESNNHFNNIQNYVNQVRNNIHQSIPRYQHMPEMHHPKSNQESYNQMMGGMNGEEMMNAAGNNQHEEGKSAGLSDTYMADSFNLNDGNRDHLSGEYKARVPRQHSHNSNIEPVYRESQTVYREDKPDRKEDIAVVNEQLNATTVVYDDMHSPANLTASKV